VGPAEAKERQPKVLRGRVEQSVDGGWRIAGAGDRQLTSDTGVELS